MTHEEGGKLVRVVCHDCGELLWSEQLVLTAPDPIRQSSIARFDNCALSLLLDVQAPGSHTSDLAALGTLWHRWVARVIAKMRASGEVQFPVDMGLDELLHVVAQRDVEDEAVVHLPMREVRWLRIAVVKWCHGGPFNAQRVIAIEEPLEGVIACPDGNGGTYERRIIGHPDVLVADPPDGIIVVDWKTGWAPPAKLGHEDREARESEQESDEKLTDQGYAQQVIYGVLILQNYPTVNRVTLREAYLRHGEYREATIDRYNLERVQDVLGAVISQIDAAFAAGPNSARWVPSAGTHCAICPNPRLCPLKDWEGIPTSLDEAQLLAREWIVAGEVRKERVPLLKGWVDANGPIPIDHSKGRREVGWTKNKTGDGRSFKLYEPDDAPESPWDERLMEAINAR
jgi:hypothetical protein